MKRDIASEAPIEFDPDDELYDPNDDAAVEAAWANGVVTVTRREKSERSRTEEIWLRVPLDVVDRYQAKGGNWQGRMDEALRKGGRLAPAPSLVGNPTEANRIHAGEVEWAYRVGIFLSTILASRT